MINANHQVKDLIQLFEHCFTKKYNTRLIHGGLEPLYQPAQAGEFYHSIIFTHDYFSSALHECAHWLIAGKTRRLLVDYGYWYMPDGRSESAQNLFEKVEVKPQALEWILSRAANWSFHVSIDNLNAPPIHTQAFKVAIFNQVQLYIQKGLPSRARLFRQALCKFYKTPVYIENSQFSLEDLG